MIPEQTVGMFTTLFRGRGDVYGMATYSTARVRRLGRGRAVSTTGPRFGCSWRGGAGGYRASRLPEPRNALFASSVATQTEQ